MRSSVRSTPLKGALCPTYTVERKEVEDNMHKPEMGEGGRDNPLPFIADTLTNVKLVLFDHCICTNGALVDTPKHQLNHIDDNAQKNIKHGARRNGAEELFKTRRHEEE